MGFSPLHQSRESQSVGLERREDDSRGVAHDPPLTSLSRPDHRKRQYDIIEHKNNGPQIKGPQIFYRLHTPEAADTAGMPVIDTGRSDTPPMMWLIIAICGIALNVLLFLISDWKIRRQSDASPVGGLNPPTLNFLVALLEKLVQWTLTVVLSSCLSRYRRQTLVSCRVKDPSTVLIQGNVGSFSFSLPDLAPYFPAMMVMALMTILCPTSWDYTTLLRRENGDWASIELFGNVRSAYPNIRYAPTTCSYNYTRQMFRQQEVCWSSELASHSYKDLREFMTKWNAFRASDISFSDSLSTRPAGTTKLQKNTTIVGSWIDTTHGNVTEQFERYGRIVNNVTMAMPHPGVYAAAAPFRDQWLPSVAYDGMKEYAIRAAVVAPAINVMCVNMAVDEVSRFVHTTRPPGVNMSTATRQDETHTRTNVDDIFKWGPAYRRSQPVFRMFPSNHNMITQMTYRHQKPDATYVLAKSAETSDYTVCQLQSWLSPACSTRVNISNTESPTVYAHCDDPDDSDALYRSVPTSKAWQEPSSEWNWLAEQWISSGDMTSSRDDSRATNARDLTQLALQQPRLLPDRPSMAEALAVYGGWTLIVGAMQTYFRHDSGSRVRSWTAKEGSLQSFNASIHWQQHTSVRTFPWIFALIRVVTAQCIFVMLILWAGTNVSLDWLRTSLREPKDLVISRQLVESLSGSKRQEYHCRHDSCSALQFPTEAAYYRHLRNEHKELPIICEYPGCNRTGLYAFDTEAELNAHQIAHIPATSLLMYKAVTLLAPLSRFIRGVIARSSTMYSRTRTVPDGWRRIYWKCPSCQIRLFDDFLELEKGSLDALERKLSLRLDERAQSPSTTDAEDGNTPSPRSSYSAQTTSPATDSSSRPAAQMNKPDRGAHGHPSSTLTSFQNSQILQNIKLAYLLCCFPRGQYGSFLHQERIDKVTSDRTLFEFLRAFCNERQCSRRFINPFRTVRGLRIGKFLLARSSLVDFKMHDASCTKEQCICLPPAHKVEPNPTAEYRCRPIPPLHIPPIGEEFLMHSFSSPSCIDPRDTWVYSQFPKRTCGRLAGEFETAAEGWGVCFRMGWDWAAIWAILLSLFLIPSLVFLIAWTMWKHDIQGASGVAAYWVTVGTIVVGYFATRVDGGK